MPKFSTLSLSAIKQWVIGQSHFFCHHSRLVLRETVTHLHWTTMDFQSHVARKFPKKMSSINLPSTWKLRHNLAIIIIMYMYNILSVNDKVYCMVLSVCRSVNEVICHGIPDMRPLEDGDLLNSRFFCIMQFSFHCCKRMAVLGLTGVW